MIKLFSGSANVKLSGEVANLLKLPLSQSEVVRFDNSEIKVSIKEPVKDSVCIVIQPTANPTDTHLMELFFFADALKRSEAKKIIAFIPYFGYARQNREHKIGEAVSANVVIRFIETIGYDQVFTIDLHDEATEGIFSIPFSDLTALPILASEIKKYLGDEKKIENIVIVSPDQGGVERARNFSQSFFDDKREDIVVIEKKRNLDIPHQSEAIGLYGDVKGKICVLVDDIVTSGGTLVHAAELCMKEGAKSVIAAITHHDFSQKAPKILADSPIEKIFTTNTILLKSDQNFEKLKEVTIAPLIANSCLPLLS